MVISRLFELLGRVGGHFCAWRRTVDQRFPSDIRSAARRRTFQNNFTARGNDSTYLTKRRLTHGQAALTIPTDFYNVRGTEFFTEFDRLFRQAGC